MLTRRGGASIEQCAYGVEGSAWSAGFVMVRVARIPVSPHPMAAVGYSGVHTGVHYRSDVMAGTVLGLSVGTVVSRTTLVVGPLAHH
jgi:hypothetical protein